MSDELERQLALERLEFDALQAERDELSRRLADLERQRAVWQEQLAEADRRAGAAERELEFYKDSQARRDSWLYKAKLERGYTDHVSFDTVWAETCKKADERNEARNAALEEAAAAIEDDDPFFAEVIREMRTMPNG
jgi:chromosome segregation ATPase